MTFIYLPERIAGMTKILTDAFEAKCSMSSEPLDADKAKAVEDIAYIIMERCIARHLVEALVLHKSDEIAKRTCENLWNMIGTICQIAYAINSPLFGDACSLRGDILFVTVHSPMQVGITEDEAKDMVKRLTYLWHGIIMTVHYFDRTTCPITNIMTNLKIASGSLAETRRAVEYMNSRLSKKKPQKRVRWSEDEKTRVENIWNKYRTNKQCIEKAQKGQKVTRENVFDYVKNMGILPEKIQTYDDFNKCLNAKSQAEHKKATKATQKKAKNQSTVK